MTIDEYVQDITSEFDRGEVRYWVEGYMCSTMRTVEKKLRETFPNVQLTEYSNDPDACAFSVDANDVNPDEMRKIADERQRLIASGETDKLPR